MFKTLKNIRIRVLTSKKSPINFTMSKGRVFIVRMLNNINFQY
jgi:hypothetical protein